MAKQTIVVTGLGIVSCHGSDNQVAFDSLIEGKSGVIALPPFEKNPLFFNAIAAPHQTVDFSSVITNPKDLRRFDPVIKFGLFAANKALENAGFDLKSSDWPKNRIGCIVGSGIGGLHTLEANIGGELSKVSPFFIAHAITNSVSGYIAIYNDLRGPNYSVTTACSTGNHALLLAREHLIKGEADIMLAGAAEASITPYGLAGFENCRALSTRFKEPDRASRPFDKERDGFVMGEGAAVLVLETLEHALDRGAPILAEFLGGSMTSDAYDIVKPSGEGARRAMRLALEYCDLDPEQIDYINAHGTSTPLGDLAEFMAIKAIFESSKETLSISGTKSMTGHLLGAASALEAFITVMALKEGKVPPTINLDNLDDQMVGWDFVPHIGRKKAMKFAMSNAFGFGGHNATTIWKKWGD